MRKAVWLCFFVALLSALSALTQSGRIDVTFNAPEFSGSPSLWPKADGRLVIIAQDPANSLYYAQKVFTLTDLGAIDPTFNPKLPPDFTPLAGTVDCNENIVLAGEFGTNRSEFSLIRLLPTGLVDTTFSFATLAVYSLSEWALTLKPTLDGKIWIGYLDPSLTQVFRLYGSDGFLQREVPMPPDVLGSRFQIQSTNLIANEDFASGDVAVNRLVRILSDGSFDPAFQAPSPSWEYQVERFLIDSENRILIAGIHYYAARGREVFWRLLPEGALDPSFPPVTSDGNIYAIALQPDGKIVVRGSFTLLNGIAKPSLARLNVDGSVDLTFNPVGSAVGTSVSELGVIVHHDGRILTVATTSNTGRLLRFWGDNFLRLDGFTFDPAGLAKLTFTNTMNRDWVLEKSPDLKSWQPVTTNGASAVEVRLDEAAAGANYFRGILR